MRNVVTMPVAAGRLFLLGLLLLCSLAPAWRPAPARAAGCAASLALHLRAGVPSPPGVTAYPPGSGPALAPIPPGTVTIHVPLYPGAAPTTEQETMPSFDVPGTPYLKSAVATYLLPVDVGTAQQW